jgi:hypothetical protein
MKQIWMSVVFALCAVNGYCQQFVTLYDHNGFSNDGGAIVKIDGGYLTTHPATDPFNGYTTLVAAIADNGTLLWDTSLTSNTANFSQSNLNTGIIPTENNQVKWVVGNYSQESYNNLKPFLQKIDINGETSQLIILDTLDEQRPDTWSGFANVFGIYLLCRDNTLDGNKELLIVKCAPNGEYLWHHSFDTGLTFNPKCIVDVGDGFIVGGWRYATLTDQSNHDGQQYIRKFNYEGVSQWTNTLAFEDNTNLGAIGIVKLDNGNYLFAGTKFIDDVSIQPLIGELDAMSGDTLWTKLYFESEEYDPNDLEDFNSINRIHGFKKLSDGGYLGVGECRHEIIPDSAFGPLDNAAFMMKLDAEYNLLWKRIYVPEGYAELDASPAQCQLNDFVENEDGSITALGRVYMYTGSGPQGGYIQDSYLIRVDSFGCLVSGCEVGITEYEPNSELTIYPNPATHNVVIEFPHRDNWQLEIYDGQARLIERTYYSQSVKSILNISNLPSGFYSLMCKSSNGYLTINKLIKE